MAPIETFCRCDVLYENVLICDLCRRNVTSDTVVRSPLVVEYIVQRIVRVLAKTTSSIEDTYRRIFSVVAKKEMNVSLRSR